MLLNLNGFVLVFLLFIYYYFSENTLSFMADWKYRYAGKLTETSYFVKRLRLDQYSFVIISLTIQNKHIKHYFFYFIAKRHSH